MTNSLPPPIDPILHAFIAMIRMVGERTDCQSEYEVMFQMGGLIVSGTVISERDFILSHPVGETFDELAKTFAPTFGSELERPGLWYVHLRNARFFLPGQSEPLPRNSGVYWRGRIDRIDGFSLVGLSMRPQRADAPAPGQAPAL